MSARRISVAFVPERIAVDWRDGAELIGMGARGPESNLAAAARRRRFYRWTRARGIVPDEAGLYAVRRLQEQFLETAA